MRLRSSTTPSAEDNHNVAVSANPTLSSCIKKNNNKNLRKLIKKDYSVLELLELNVHRRKLHKRNILDDPEHRLHNKAIQQFVKSSVTEKNYRTRYFFQGFIKSVTELN